MGNITRSEGDRASTATETNMPGKVLPDKELEQWMRQGLKDAEIVEKLRSDKAIIVTRQAISAWRKRRGMNMRAQSPRTLPWKVSEEHRQMEPARAIRLYARRERGEVLQASEEIRLNRVLDALGKDKVFHYLPEPMRLANGQTLAAGWIMVPRRAGVDKGIVREPELVTA